MILDVVLYKWQKANNGLLRSGMLGAAGTP
jgi:hypothetical protein